MSCPVCLNPAAEPLYEALDVPIHSVVLLHERDQALQYPRHDLRLRHCAECGFIFNASFEPDRLRYGPGYDGSQCHSDHFGGFLEDLAESLVDRFDLKGRTILEVGCGQGEFLKLLCRDGRNTGIGYDPAYLGPPTVGSVQCHAAFFPPPGSRWDPPPDLVVCRMTLEHIAAPRRFIHELARACGEDTVLFLQVPDAERILSEGAFWDLYYEHCSYFRRESITHLLRATGFRTTRADAVYAGQYLSVDARKGSEGSAPAVRSQAPDRFAERVKARKQALRDRATAARGPVLLWGAGSKAVALAHALPDVPFAGAVDVNPAKHGTFLPGSGLPVLSPARVADIDPELVIALNPVYAGEIGARLQAAGCAARLESV